MAPNTRETKMDLKICSINICGMFERSRFMLDKFEDVNTFDVITVQESETIDEEKLNITNMKTFTDDIRARNKGAVIYTRRKHTFTKLKELNQLSKNIDTSWGVVGIQNKRYIIGSLYMKLNNADGIQEVINMLNKAHNIKGKLKSCGVILTGDFNARHASWGDTTSNAYGKKLVELLDSTKYSICHANSPTFLSTNGSSCIDLMIITNNLVENVEYIRTDTEVELHSGAPFRGLLPLISSFRINTPRMARQAQATVKISTNNISWERWTSDLEQSLEEKEAELQTLNDPEALKDILDKTIELVTLKHGKKKISSDHSKPYWTNKLTKLCNEMRQAWKNYCKRNTNINKERLIQAKKLFDDERKLECQEFLLRKTKNLNSTQALDFWREFNKIFKKKTQQNIDPLMDKEGNLLTDHKEVEELMFSTFFEGQHLIDRDFDHTFYVETIRMYDEIINDNTDEHEFEECSNEINSEITVGPIRN